MNNTFEIYQLYRSLFEGSTFELKEATLNNYDITVIEREAERKNWLSKFVLRLTPEGATPAFYISKMIFEVPDNGR